jgi:hypothetical protein
MALRNGILSYHITTRRHNPEEDEDRDGLRNVGLLTAQPFGPADSPRQLHHTQSPGKQQI